MDTSSMSYLLFPGRHLVNTAFQARYLTRVLTEKPSAVPGIVAGKALLQVPPTEVLFAVTSANQENSRFNPIPFHIRAVGIDRFARQLQAELAFRFRILGIPHYGHTKNFAAFTLKEIADQTEKSVQLTPENCLVLCSTPEVVRLYQELGFSVATAELSEPVPHPATPIEIIREIGVRGEAWRSGPLSSTQLAPSHVSLFEDFPEVPKRIARLYQDPLTNQEGSLTDTRNYSSYARGMNEIIRLKYLDIREAIRPGRIVDEGCADGALLAEVSRDFPDSDLFGIDLSAEFAGRFCERQRAGEFGGAYVHFFHRNLLDRIFEPDSIDTTICNSTLHELWSYAEQEKTVRAYLAEKYRQLRPGSRLIIRDVFGPEDGDQVVFLYCCRKDGKDLWNSAWQATESRSAEWLRDLSTYSRFRVFAHDFLAGRRTKQKAAFKYASAEQDSHTGFMLSLRAASEFLSKKDYLDNWRSEMNEEFCFWSFTRWKQVLSETGFHIIEDPNQPEKGSRAYTNPWIVKNRYEGNPQLHSVGGSPLSWPPTNMVLVAEKLDH
ncbi:MAG TPA: methyltransferase [Clostridia bacterium]|nr:methyltransferase [Clostridia bacterium]